MNSWSSGILEHDADPPADLGAGCAARRAARRCVTVPRLAALIAVEGEHERRLAGAVRAEHGDPLAGARREVDAAQRVVTVGVGEREVAHLEGRACHRDHHASDGDDRRRERPQQAHDPRPGASPARRGPASIPRSRATPSPGTPARRARTSGRTARRPSWPRRAPARAARRRTTRLAGDAHAPDLVGDHVAVADHERR